MNDLTVVVPARNEMWLAQTCKDVLAASSDSTKVLVILDGEWPEPPGLDVHPRLDIIKVPASIGQRAATNLGIKVARTKYAMKLDAHCSMAPGFDVELMNTAEQLGPDTVQVPLQYNLHVFNRVCTACQYHEDMGPSWNNCPKCKAPNTMERQLVWQRRMNRKTSGWYFDKDLHFQYWGQWSDAHANDEVHDIMSCLGACWFVNREWYWSVDGLDEGHGSWGQMGTELACKSWLSGGRMVCNKRTWFAHMFRTQGGDFGFPYPLSGKEVSTARAHSRKLWIDGKWPKAKLSLRWMLEKFNNELHFPPPNVEQGKKNPSWTDEDIAKIVPLAGQLDQSPKLGSNAPTKGVVWYSDAFGRGDTLFQEIVQASWKQLLQAAEGIPIVSVVLGDLLIPWRLEPEHQHVRMSEPRGYLTMFRQILTGLETLDTDIVYLCEHDVLYSKEHFMLPVRRDRPSYNQNVWKVDSKTGHALHYRCSQTSGLSCDRKVLLEHYRKRVALIEERTARGEEKPFLRSMGFEPGTRQTRHGGIDDLEHDVWMSTVPLVDIRHGSNLTPSRWRKDEFRHQRFTKGWTEAEEVPGWGSTGGRFHAWLHDVVNNKTP